MSAPKADPVEVMNVDSSRNIDRDTAMELFACFKAIARIVDKPDLLWGADLVAAVADLRAQTPPKRSEIVGHQKAGGSEADPTYIVPLHPSDLMQRAARNALRNHLDKLSPFERTARYGEPGPHGYRVDADEKHALRFMAMVLAAPTPSTSCEDRLKNAKAELADLRAQLAAAVERERVLVDLVKALRADLKMAVETDVTMCCETCRAPLFHDEDVATVADVESCWGSVAECKSKTPCFRYRTEQGADRAWPACDLIDAIAFQSSAAVVREGE